MRHAIRVDPIWRPFLAPFGGTARGSWVDVRAEAVRVRFGPGFDARIPRREIAEAAPAEWPWWGGIGWRLDFCGRVALVGSHRGVVRLRLRSSRSTRLFGFLPLRFRELYVSLEDPARFLAELG